jgi:hypothetical protein
MAKANNPNDDVQTGEATVGDEAWRDENTEQTEPEGRHSADGGGLRERTEQGLETREQYRAAERYAPPAGEGAKVNPDAQRNDPDGEARPTA